MTRLRDVAKAEADLAASAKHALESAKRAVDSELVACKQRIQTSEDLVMLREHSRMF